MVDKPALRQMAKSNRGAAILTRAPSTASVRGAAGAAALKRVALELNGEPTESQPLPGTVEKLARFPMVMPRHAPAIQIRAHVMPPGLPPTVPEVIAPQN